MTGPSNPLAPFVMLRELANRQADAVAQDNLARFAELCKLRDHLVERLPSPVDGATRAAAAKLLEAVIVSDALVQDLLRDGQAAVRAELRQLGRGRRAMHAYVVPPSVESTGGRA
jgi:hypothetical protein